MSDIIPAHVHIFERDWGSMSQQAGFQFNPIESELYGVIRARKNLETSKDDKSSKFTKSSNHWDQRTARCNAGAAGTTAPAR